MRERVQDRRAQRFSQSERIGKLGVVNVEPSRFAVVPLEKNLGKHGMRLSKVI